MKTLSPKAFYAQMFIYALDPNRHLFADVPFPDYLLHLVSISARPGGLPVPEHAIRAASARCGEDVFWQEVTEQILASVREDCPTMPIKIPEDSEEIWRKMVFAYPPGRYAFVHCGEELARLAAVHTSKPSALSRFPKQLLTSENPWDRAVVRAAIDSKASPVKFRFSLTRWIRMEEMRADHELNPAQAIALAAARLVPESKVRRGKRT